MNGIFTDDSTSKSLIAGLQAGEAFAWARTAELYGPLIYTWCERFGVDDSTANDVTQTVLLTVIEKAVNFRKERPSDSFKAWLWTVTRHELLRLVRLRNRDQSLPGEILEQLNATESGEPPNTPDAYQRLVERAMRVVQNSCQPKTWEIFLASIYSRRSAADVAAEFQTSPQNVRKIRSVYLAKLRDLLELTNDADSDDSDGGIDSL